MWIVEDTRQQAGKHELKHATWKEHGDNIIRCALPWGDYMAVPPVSVDTKASMQEIAQNIGGSKAEHERFRRELIGAQEAGCHLYVLVENDEGIETLEDVARWVNPRLIDSPKAITGKRLCIAMNTMQERYGVTFLFCSPEQAAGMIHYLLERGI
jgi:hypothetical protein